MDIQKRIEEVVDYACNNLPGCYDISADQTGAMSITLHLLHLETGDSHAFEFSAEMTNEEWVSKLLNSNEYIAFNLYSVGFDYTDEFKRGFVTVVVNEKDLSKKQLAIHFQNEELKTVVIIDNVNQLDDILCNEEVEKEILSFSASVRQEIEKHLHELIPSEVDWKLTTNSDTSFQLFINGSNKRASVLYADEPVSHTVQYLKNDLLPRLNIEKKEEVKEMSAQEMQTYLQSKLPSYLQAKVTTENRLRVEVVEIGNEDIFYRYEGSIPEKLSIPTFLDEVSNNATCIINERRDDRIKQLTDCLRNTLEDIVADRVKFLSYTNQIAAYQIRPCEKDPIVVEYDLTNYKSKTIAQHAETILEKCDMGLQSHIAFMKSKVPVDVQVDAVRRNGMMRIGLDGQPMAVFIHRQAQDAMYGIGSTFQAFIANHCKTIAKNIQKELDTNATVEVTIDANNQYEVELSHKDQSATFVCPTIEEATAQAKRDYAAMVAFNAEESAKKDQELFENIKNTILSELQGHNSLNINFKRLNATDIEISLHNTTFAPNEIKTVKYSIQEYNARQIAFDLIDQFGYGFNEFKDKCKALFPIDVELKFVNDGAYYSCNQYSYWKDRSNAMKIEKLKSRELIHSCEDFFANYISIKSPFVVQNEKIQDAQYNVHVRNVATDEIETIIAPTMEKLNKQLNRFNFDADKVTKELKKKLPWYIDYQAMTDSMNKNCTIQLKEMNNPKSLENMQTFIFKLKDELFDSEIKVVEELFNTSHYKNADNSLKENKSTIFTKLQMECEKNGISIIPDVYKGDAILVNTNGTFTSLSAKELTEDKIDQWITNISDITDLNRVNLKEKLEAMLPKDCTISIEQYKTANGDPRLTIYFGDKDYSVDTNSTTNAQILKNQFVIDQIANQKKRYLNIVKQSLMRPGMQLTLEYIGNNETTLHLTATYCGYEFGRNFKQQSEITDSFNAFINRVDDIQTKVQQVRDAFVSSFKEIGIEFTNKLRLNVVSGNNRIIVYLNSTLIATFAQDTFDMNYVNRLAKEWTTIDCSRTVWHVNESNEELRKFTRINRESLSNKEEWELLCHGGRINDTFYEIPASFLFDYFFEQKGEVSGYFKLIHNERVKTLLRTSFLRNEIQEDVARYLTENVAVSYNQAAKTVSIALRQIETAGGVFHLSADVPLSNFSENKFNPIFREDVLTTGNIYTRPTISLHKSMQQFPGLLQNIEGVLVSTDGKVAYIDPHSHIANFSGLQISNILNDSDYSINGLLDYNPPLRQQIEKELEENHQHLHTLAITTSISNNKQIVMIQLNNEITKTIESPLYQLKHKYYWVEQLSKAFQYVPRKFIDQWRVAVELGKNQENKVPNELRADVIHKMNWLNDAIKIEIDSVKELFGNHPIRATWRNVIEFLDATDVEIESKLMEMYNQPFIFPDEMQKDIGFISLNQSQEASTFDARIKLAKEFEVYVQPNQGILAKDVTRFAKMSDLALQKIFNLLPSLADKVAMNECIHYWTIELERQEKAKKRQEMVAEVGRAFVSGATTRAFHHLLYDNNKKSRFASLFQKIGVNYFANKEEQTRMQKMMQSDAFKTLLLIAASSGIESVLPEEGLFNKNQIQFVKQALKESLQRISVNKVQSVVSTNMQLTDASMKLLKEEF